MLKQISFLSEEKTDGGNVHDTILTVNEIHRQFSINKAKRTTTDQEIIDNNLSKSFLKTFKVIFANLC